MSYKDELNQSATRLPSKKLFKQYDPSGSQDLDEWRRVFVETGDPTEYEAAIILCGTWSEWERIKYEWPYFAKNILTEWQEELEVKLRSRAIKCLVAASTSGEKDASAAAKWLAEGKYNPKGVGRPNKDKKSLEAKIKERVKEETDDEVSRVLNANPQSNQILPN